MEKQPLGILKVGDKLFFVPRSYGRQPQVGVVVVVTKVGRVWAALTGYHCPLRVNKSTGNMDADKYGWLGDIYVNESDYLAEKELTRGWADLVTYFNGKHTIPKHISIETVNIIRAALGLTE